VGVVGGGGGEGALGGGGDLGGRHVGNAVGMLVCWRYLLVSFGAGG
jgi:hypothetical protein